MKTKLILLPILATLILGGCATRGPEKPYASKPDQSRAWNIASAAGLRLKDVELPQGNQDIDADSGPGLLSSATFAGANYLSPPPGFSPGAAGAMGFLSFFLSTKKAPKEIMSQVVAWLPKSQAQTPEDAADRVFAMVRDEMKQILARPDRIAPYWTGSTKEKFVNAGNRSRIWEMTIHGQECEEENATCGIGLFVNRHLDEDVIDGFAPDFLGGGPAWRVSVLLDGWVKKSRTYYAAPDLLNLYVELSRRLPEWAFLYIGPFAKAFPGNATATRNKEGKRIWVKYPLVLDHGKPLYFVKPNS